MEKVFLQACRGEQTPHTPIWLNRQAGRYMPEYHQVKADLPSLDFFKNPEKAAQATLDAQRILGVDAAIMFADLLPILEPMGLNLEYVPGKARYLITRFEPQPTWPIWPQRLPLSTRPISPTPCAASMKACPKILR